MIEDFNVDSGDWFPNQQLDGDPTECVGICVADICGDIDNVNYDPDYTYAMTLKLMGSQPSTAGSDPFTGLLSAVAYGCLPMADADFSAATLGELYTADWRNYPDADRTTALSHVQRGVKPVPLTFDDVIAEAKINKGVALNMHWHSAFLDPTHYGFLPPISGAYTLHEPRVVGQKTVDGQRYQIIKPWLGKDYGIGGYSFLSEEQFNQTAISAYRFDPDAIRFFSLIGIAATRYPYLLDILPYLYRVNIQTIQTILNI